MTSVNGRAPARRGGAMRAFGKGLASILISVLACGCASSPAQSQRTGQGQDYSRYVFALYDQPSGGATSRLRPSVPMNIAVAEVGQLHPDPKLLREITADGRMFRRVQPMTGIADGDYAADPYRSDASASAACPAGAAAPRLALARLQRLARDT